MAFANLQWVRMAEAGLDANTLLGTVYTATPKEVYVVPEATQAVVRNLDLACFDALDTIARANVWLCPRGVGATDGLVNQNKSQYIIIPFMAISGVGGVPGNDRKVHYDCMFVLNAGDSIWAAAFTDSNVGSNIMSISVNGYEVT